MSALVHAVTQLALAEARRALGSLRRALSPDAVDALFCALLAAQWPVAREILSPVIAEDVERHPGDVRDLLALLVVVERAEEETGPMLPPPPGPAERAELAAWCPEREGAGSGVEISAHFEAILEMWPAAAPTLPWQLDHEVAS